jgi:hypothetical protein
MSDLRDEIEIVLNKHSAENGSSTPDFILAQYLMDCLQAFDGAVTARMAWYGAEIELAKERLDAATKEKS